MNAGYLPNLSSSEESMFFANPVPNPHLLGLFMNELSFCLKTMSTGIKQERVRYFSPSSILVAISKGRRTSIKPVAFFQSVGERGRNFVDWAP